jgi:uncharacterized protein
MKQNEKQSTFEVHLQPGARKSEVAGFKGDVLYIKVTAAPEKGQANQALIDLLAELLDVAKSNISLIRGATSRSKVISVEGIDAAELKTRLEKATKEDSVVR